jgi:hypothetical protein
MKLSLVHLTSHHGLGLHFLHSHSNAHFIPNLDPEFTLPSLAESKTWMCVAQTYENGHPVGIPGLTVDISQLSTSYRT